MLQDEHVIELLSASLDDTLSPEEVTELEAILAASPEARQMLEAMSCDRAALRALPALKVPENLKLRTKLKAQASPGASVTWKRSLMAASALLAVGLATYFYRPISDGQQHLYLHSEKLAWNTAVESEEVILTPDSSKPHALLSPTVSGVYNGRSSKLILQGDAGTSSGAVLWARLSYDFDGDGVYDSHSEPQILKLDETEGYEKLAFEFPAQPDMRDLTQGRVKVELSSHKDGKTPLKVKFDPEQARLELPFDRLSEHQS